MDRILILCPTFHTQKTFDAMRHLVMQQDVWLGGKNDIADIHRVIKVTQTMRAAKGQPSIRFLVVIDDMAGTQQLHGGTRVSPFGNFAIQTPHLNTSLIVVTQQPTCVSPSFRDNAEYICVFPSEGLLEVDWLKRNFQSLLMETGEMRSVILTAWRGGKNNNQEWGKHFLVIEATPRKHSLFWIDGEREIRITREQ